MKKILIFGGDNRNMYLYDLFKSSGYSVDRCFLDKNCENIFDLISKSEVIITAMPFSNDNQNIYTPLCDERISIDNFINYTNNKIIFGGKISDEITKKLESNNVVYDFMKNDELAIKNTIPTVEGIIKIIVENTDITICDSKVAILGFGKVGKQTAYILEKLGASIFCLDKKKEEVANIKSCSYNVIEDICSDLKEMDIIINTIPEHIINSDVISNISKESFLLDVASNPGGIDYEYANAHGYNAIHALGIPGKVAPKTSAKYIKELIEKII